MRRRTVLGAVAAVAGAIGFTVLLSAGFDPVLTWALAGAAYLLLIAALLRWR